MAVLVGAVAVGLLYAAAALAWKAGYAPRLGPPVVHVAGAALVAVRCALVLGVSAALGLALYGRVRAALAVALTVVACAPAWAGPVYGPSQGALWTSQVARAAGADAPEVGLAVQAGAVGGLLALTLLAALTAPKAVGPSSAHGTAAWGEGRSLLDAESGLVLGRSGGRPPDAGHAVERSRGTPKKPGPLLRYDGPGHVLTVAPTRAGKGVGAVVPNLLDHPGPVVVTDPKGENLALTARYRAGILGHRVVALDPFGLAPDGLFGDVGRGRVERGQLNPLDLVEVGSGDAADDAALLAEMLVVEDGGGAGGNRFWADEAKALLAGLALHVALDYDGPGRSLLTVRELLTSDAKAFEALIGTMKGHDHPVVRRTGNRMDQKHERERSAVVSTAQSHTHFLDSPRMAGVLARSTFDPAALRSGGLPGHVWGVGDHALSDNGRLPHRRPALGLPPAPARPARRLRAVAPPGRRDDDLGARTARPAGGRRDGARAARAVPPRRVRPARPDVARPPGREPDGRVRPPGLAVLAGPRPAPAALPEGLGVVRRQRRRRPGVRDDGPVHGRVPLEDGRDGDGFPPVAVVGPEPGEALVEVA